MDSLVVFLAFCFLFASTEAQQNGDLRLKDGLYSDSGRVEIYLNGVWGTMDAGTDGSTQKGPAQTVCRQLGYDDSSRYGTVLALGLPAANDSVPMLIEQVNCPHNIMAGSARQHVLRCDYVSGTSPPNHQNDFAVTCYTNTLAYETQVRLVQGGTGFTSSGFVEIYLRGSWGPVCNMGEYDADTACRQLGYTEALQFWPSAAYNNTGKTDKVSAFYCSGDSSQCLKDCFSYSRSSHAGCTLSYDYVNCTFVVENEGLYSSGDETVCSLGSIVALAVGVAIAVFVVFLLMMIACIVVCCCCIPGCIIHSSRRKVTYETI